MSSFRYPPRTALVSLLLLALAASSANASSSRNEREAEQVRLEEACEVAREAILSVERAAYVEECVDKNQRPDRASCERFYADHGARAGNRAPLYLDLPECVEAHEFQQNNR